MSRRAWVPWIIVNAVFAGAHPWIAPALPASIRSLAVNAVLFLLPAVGWSAWLGAAPRALGMRLARHILISTTAFFAIIITLRIARITPSQWLTWDLMWAIANAGLLAAALRGRSPVRRALARRELVLGGALFAASYGLYFFAATRVVPPQIDHDLEVQATGYGLLARFEPLLLTDRHTVYYFAHPPLLHFYVAASFLYQGTWPELAFFDTVSRQIRDAGDDASREEPGALAAIYARYRERPFLVETRTPNLFFAASTVALLGLWVGRISRRQWIAVLTAAAYATSPEVFVRSGYGGYFAIGALAAMLMLLASERATRQAGWRPWVLPILVGAFAGLSDHKLILLPAAMVLSALVARKLRKAIAPVVTGFGVGIALFWVFGLSVAPAAFLLDHFHYHLIDRLTHTNPLGYGSYLSAVGLWREFVHHTGYLLLPVAVWLLVVDVVRQRGREPRRVVWLMWTVVTGAVFSLVDWRMTKHLMPLLLPLNLGLVPDRVAPPWRVGVPAFALALILAWNVKTLLFLTQHFASFTITPAW